MSTPDSSTSRQARERRCAVVLVASVVLMVASWSLLDRLPEASSVPGQLALYAWIFLLGLAGVLGLVGAIVSAIQTVLRGLRRFPGRRRWAVGIRERAGTAHSALERWFYEPSPLDSPLGQVAVATVGAAVAVATVATGLEQQRPPGVAGVDLAPLEAALGASAQSLVSGASNLQIAVQSANESVAITNARFESIEANFAETLPSLEAAILQLDATVDNLELPPVAVTGLGADVDRLESVVRTLADQIQSAGTTMVGVQNSLKTIQKNLEAQADYEERMTKRLEHWLEVDNYDARRSAFTRFRDFFVGAPEEERPRHVEPSSQPAKADTDAIAQAGTPQVAPQESP